MSTLFSQLERLGDAPVVPPRLHVSKSAATFATVAPSAASDWYDTANREAVRSAYNTVFVPTTGILLGYIGDPVNGIAGDTSAAYKAAALRRLNFFRAMGGVPSISSFDAARNAKAQQGALMIYANNALSHDPPPSWIRRTPDAVEAVANSNVCQGVLTDPGCANLYMDDFGSTNAAVGHRRWILYPNTQQMGIGDVPGTMNLWNDLWVNEAATLWGARPPTRDPFIAWPPRGFVPYQFIYSRWSFHYPDANFAGTTVAVTRNGSAVAVRIDSAQIPMTGYRYAPDNQIVFVLDNAQTEDPTTPAKPSADTSYHVTVSNVLVSGLPRTFEYDVVAFDPAIAAVSSPSVSPGLPSVISLTPLNGEGYSGTFTGSFKQSSNNHYLGYMLFLPTPNVVQYTATGSCLVEYNKYSNGVRLIDNAGTGWLGPISGVPISPSAPALTNNQCSVNVAGVVANVAGDTMTISVPVMFFGTLGQVQGTFLQALDSNGIWTGMTQFGNWALPGASQTRLGPAIATVTSTLTTGRQATYAITATHTGGVGSLSMVHLLTSSSIFGSAACQFVYFPASNLLNLINDAGTALVSAGGVAVGQPGTLANSRCSANVAAASRTQSVNAVTLTLPITYAAEFAGQKYVYANAFDNNGLLSHWVTGSTMLVQ